MKSARTLKVTTSTEREALHTRRAGPNLGAVLTIIAGGAMLAIGTDVTLHAIGVFSPWGQPRGDASFLFASACRVVYHAASGYLGAQLAPDQATLRALASVAALALSIAVFVVTRNGGRVNSQQRAGGLRSAPIEEPDVWMENCRRLWELSFQRLDVLLAEMKANG